ncbi:MAG: hypothetical protein U9R38_04495 [Candidatus Margulisiibacteriota bacterium]|nr:hypothetical protein [Candidatus Margulisiibacteriota bacterium]
MGSPGLPNSKIKILPRQCSVDKDDNFDFIGLAQNPAWLRIALDSSRIELNTVYTESELYQIAVEEFGEVSREAVASLFIQQYPSFVQLMRPRCREHEERLFVRRGRQPYSNIRFVNPRCHEHEERPVVRRGGQPKTVPVFLLEGPEFFYFGSEPESELYTLALKKEIKEIVKEGRAVPVYFQKNRAAYFTPDALAQWLEAGDILEVEENNALKYVFTQKSGVFFAGGKAKIRRKSMPAASEALLSFLRNKQLSRRERLSFPLLAEAIQALASSPQGTDPYFEAARIAAEHGASETSLAALLLQKILPEYTSPSYDWLLNKRGLPTTFIQHLKAVHGETGFSWRRWPLEVRLLGGKVADIRHVSGMHVGLMRIQNAGDIHTYLQLFLNVLGFDSSYKQETYLEYFATVLGKLRHTPVRALKKEEERNLRVVVAPLAERRGFSGLAAMIRNEIFRISYNRAYNHFRRKIEKATGLTYSEMELHLQDTVNLIREVIAAAGIAPEDYEIFFRVKLPYSAWEKMQANKISDPGQVHDLLGMSIVAENDRLVRRIEKLIPQVLPNLSLENFKDPHELLPHMRENRLPTYKDQIAKPADSGFSAITMIRLTMLKLPAEVQVTSRERDRINREGVAAHWKHKIRREIKHFYGIEIAELADLVEHKDKFSVVLYGDWKGNIRKTLNQGLDYKVFDNLQEKDVAEFLDYNPHDKLFYLDHWKFRRLGRIRRVSALEPLQTEGDHSMTYLFLVLRDKK